MGERLGEAILELRTDDSGLSGGISKAKGEAEGLADSFGIASAKIATSTRGVGASATAMAVAAQASAKSAVAQAAGFEAVAAKAQLSTLAMRETLTVGRELARGNWTRIPGSLTLLLQGVGTTGGFKAYVSSILQTVGVLKTYQDAELAAEAATTASSAAAVRLAAQRAGANILAADTEVALAEAAVAVADGSDAEAAAQARLALAHEAVAAAAAEAEIAETALAGAEERAAVAGSASAAATRTSLTALGAGLGVVTIGAALAFAGFKAFQMEVKDSGDLDRYAEKLRLTDEQIRKAGGSIDYLSSKQREISGLTVTFGDVVSGVWKTIADHAGLDDSMNGLKREFLSQMEDLVNAGVDVFAELYGDIVGTYRAAVLIWDKFPAALGDAFYTAVNSAIGAINDLLKASTEALNGFIGKANGILGVFGYHVGAAVAPQIDLVKNQYAGAAKEVAGALGNEIKKATAEGAAAGHAIVAETMNNIIGAAETRLKKESDGNRPPKPKKPKKQSDHGLAEALATLDAEIKGQEALANAYLVSDGAAMKAEALQKAEEDAIKHKSETGVFYEKELQKAVATSLANNAKVIAGLRDDAEDRGKVNAMIAAGQIPAAQMQQQLDLETKKRQLLVDLMNGDATQKAMAIVQLAALADAQAKYNSTLSETTALEQESQNADEIAKLKLEASLVGASNRERAVALAQLEAKQKLESMPGLSVADQQKYIQSYVDAANASIRNPFQEFAASIPQTAAAINDALQSISMDGLKNLNDGIANAIVNSKSLGDAFHSVAQQMLQDLIKLALQEAEMAIFKAIMGAVSVGAGGGGAGGIGFGGFHANGGMIPAGTFGIVGERGPEPVIATPRGTMVLPNSSLRQGMAANDRGPSVPININIDATGADAAGLARVQAELAQLRRDLPSQIVGTMSDARSRFIWRG